MQVNGLEIKGMVLVFNSGQMEQNMKVNENKT